LNYARNLLPKVEWATCEHFTDGFSVGKILIYGGNIKEYLAVCQNIVPLVNIKIAGKWMFIPLKMYL
jgi:hypothetical protein